MWLDVARFADTKGYVFTADRNYAEAYLFRNWVIRSFNHDRPYDEFVRYQLAADQFRPDSPDDLAAMGFLTLGRRFLNNKHDIIDDRIDVTTRGLMGLTVTCARCHDHKFDPIPMEDYYSLYGVFDSSREPGDAPATLRLIDKETPTTPVVFLRGQPNQEGPEVPRRFLRVLAGPDRQPFQHGSGRREMAESIASAQNPLTARVFVNRVWGRLLGTFLIDTPSDFGVRTTRPPLADVLDELTVDFQRHDWSLKWLVREIVTSATYRQTSASQEDGERLDPTNQWYWRMNRRRLDFESLRDAILAVSDQLDASMIGGPSVDITTAELNGRRSLYAHIDRQNFPGLFRAFDVAGPDTHAPKRYETTVPQQALYLLNSPFALDSAAGAARASATDSGDAAARVRQIYQRVLGRDPDEWEQQRAVDFVSSMRPADAAGDAAGHAASNRDQEQDVWSELAQVLIMSNEFSYLD
jgi:hypothetical protein